VEIDGIERNFDGIARVLQGGERLEENFGDFGDGPAIQVTAVVEPDAEDLGGLARSEKLDGIERMDGAGGSGRIEKVAREFVYLSGFEKAIGLGCVQTKSYKLGHGLDDSVTGTA
jgi:hypothetical protein